MALAPGDRIGAFEIVALLGAGGMGEVYRARDPKLGRDVAIKVLPELFADDPERLARLQREAVVLASLNHPYIAHIYGVEDTRAGCALVMELVDGPTLAERIAAGPLPPAEALPIARAIASALEAAHEQGIVHRDLKPANVKVRADGTVKVLDFGLAKAITPGTVSTASAMVSPTVSVHGTAAGVTLGTAAYMAPEQVRGGQVDRRADLWAFGVVLFEMLTARHPFAGPNVPDTLAEVLKSDPPWSLLPADAPAAAVRVIRRCLQKDPRQRQQHIGDARLDLEEASQPEAFESAPRSRAISRRERWLWAAALLAVVATLVSVAMNRATPAATTPMSIVDIDTSSTSAPTSFALSPDGRTLAYTATAQNKRQLFLRSLDSGATRTLVVDDAIFPFWSPDGQSLGFFNMTSGKLMTVDLTGGAPLALASTLTPAGGSWNQDGTILYVPVDNAGMYRIPARGGERTALSLGEPETIKRFPQFLPDGRHFLYYTPSGAMPGAVHLGTLGTTETRRLFTADTPAFYTAGQILFGQQGALFSRPFNVDTMTAGDPVSRIADDVALDGISVGVSASTAGTIAYRTGGSQGRRRRLVWFDRSGKELGVAGDQPPQFINNPSLSRDGRRVAVTATEQQNADVYLLDLERNVFDRLTLAPSLEAMPIWSPDMTRIVYTSIRGLWMKTLDGSAADTLLTLPGETIRRIATDWSPDGQFLLCKQFELATATFDLWAYSVSGDRPAIPVATTPYNEREGQFSPDGKMIAFQSDELGRPEIYLQPFPGPGARVKISVGGGSQARWRQDGRELYYLAPDSRLMAIAMDPTPRGPKAIGAPFPLFQTRIFMPPAGIHRQQYMVSPDGKRFLINTADAADVPPITLLLNWRPVRP